MAKKKSEKGKPRREIQTDEGCLKCPHCQFDNDPETVYRSQGSFKCMNCGEEFEYEVVKKITYVTW